MDASKMTIEKIRSELRTLGERWDAFRTGSEGHGGSPGEWMVERMGELETEQKRRASPAGRLGRASVKPRFEN